MTRFSFQLIIFGCFLWGSIAQAKISKEQGWDFIYSRSANYLNSKNDFKGIVKHVKNTLGNKEGNRLKEIFRKVGAHQLKKKVEYRYDPSAKKLVFSGGSISFTKDFNLLLQSKNKNVLVVMKKIKTPSQLAQVIHEKFSNKKTAFFMDALFPKAMAQSKGTSRVFGFVAGAIAAVATAAAFDTVGAAVALGAGSIVAQPFVAIGMGILVGVAVYQTLMDGNIQCDGKHFTVRKRKWLISHELVPIDMELVKIVLGDQVDGCTQEDADLLETRLKTAPAAIQEVILEPSPAEV